MIRRKSVRDRVAELLAQDRRQERGWMMWFILFLNVVSTIAGAVVTYTSNPGVNRVLGTFDEIKSYLRNGEINLGLYKESSAWLKDVPEVNVVADDWTFYKAPSRNMASMGQTFSKCERIMSDETLHSSVHWLRSGEKVGMRDLIRVDSDYLSGCEVINMLADVDLDLYTFLKNNNSTNVPQCSATGCSALGKFLREELRTLDLLNAGDFDGGRNGVPYLLCPLGTSVPQRKPAAYMVLQKPWHGAQYSFEIQISMCENKMFAIDHARQTQIWRILSTDDNADVFFAVANWGFAGSTFMTFYSFLSVFLILYGTYQIFKRDEFTVYVHSQDRASLGFFSRVVGAFNMRYFTRLSAVHRWIRFRSNKWVGSELWMNHWLFLYSSYIYGFLTLRETYIVLEIGVYMTTAGNPTSWGTLLFIAGGMVRLCWTCLAFTELMSRLVIILAELLPPHAHFVLKRVLSLRFWISYKVQVFYLLALFSVLLGSMGKTTFMQGREVIPMGDRGPVTVNFWASENVTDLVTLWLLVCALNAVTVLMLYIAAPLSIRIVENSIVQVLRHKYQLMGWDLLLCYHTLQLREAKVGKKSELTMLVSHCPFGDVLEMIYKSGPNGLIVLEGEDVFIPTKEYLPNNIDITCAIQLGLLARHSNRSNKQRVVPRFSKESTTMNGSVLANGMMEWESERGEQMVEYIGFKHPVVLRAHGSIMQHLTIMHLGDYLQPRMDPVTRTVQIYDMFGGVPLSKIGPLIEGDCFFQFSSPNL